MKVFKKYFSRRSDRRDRNIVVPIDGDSVILVSKGGSATIFESEGKFYGIGVFEQPVKIMASEGVIDEAMRYSSFFPEEKVAEKADAEPDGEEESEPVAKKRPYVRRK